MKSKINYNEVLKTNDQNLKKLHDIVLKTIQEEELLAHKLTVKEEITIGQRLADQVANFGGSWKFILIFSVFIAIWMSINIFWMTNKAFDPYPFILLNLILSCLAAMRAPVIMMSQNRKEQRDRLTAEEDYMVNLKAEIEIRTVHDKLDILITEQMKSLFDIQQVQMDKIEALEKNLKHKLNN